MQPIELEVNQENIDEGSRDSCRWCQIAIALLRFDWQTYLGLDKLPHVEVSVGDCNMHVSLPSLLRKLRIDTTIEARDFIYKFDRTGRDAVVPTTFTLQPVETE